MSSIAIIPARGGSKRIPRKNVQILDGKPLISFPIVAAIESNVFNDIFVSTDDPEIAEIAKSYGAKVPFLRSPDLADDFTPTMPVIRDSIERITKLNYSFDKCCCIYPTSIFVTSNDLVQAHNQLMDSPGKDFVVSVVKYPYPIQRALGMNKALEISFLNPANLLTRSQDLSDTFHDAAQFYWGHKLAWIESESAFINAIGYQLDSSKIQDIDDEEDLRRAEFLFRSNKTLDPL
jgi:pseudaminic acid cytidylyltransferase